MAKKIIHFSEAVRINKIPEAFQVMVKPAGPQCNLNCTYCYYLEKKELYPVAGNLTMPDEALERFIIQYIEEQKADTITFTWQGGEPALAGLAFYEKALALQKKYAGSRNIENNFQTNGTLLNDDWCRFFADNGFLVGISVDGPEDIHDHYRQNIAGKGSFQPVMKSIGLLQKYKVEFNTLTVVNIESSKYPEKVYRFLKNIPSRYIQFIPVVERRAKNTNGLQLIPPGYPCDADVAEWSVTPAGYGNFLVTVFDEWVRSDVGRYFVQIFDVALANWVGVPGGLCVFDETCGLGAALEHNGDLYSCDHYVYNENHLGNIMERSLGDMFRSDKQFRFGMAKKDDLPLYCRRCNFLFACHGECPKHRFILAPNGEKGLNYLCESYKIFFGHVAPYMQFMVEELKHQRPPANIMEHLRNKEKRENQE